jgi:hypothetical protein
MGATKEVCLMNFVDVFNESIFGQASPSMCIIADRCERKTVGMLNETGIPVILSDNGNAGSFLLALQHAVENYPEDELIYFCEDDYLHLHKSPKLLEEGIRRTDYVTLYDHPDKYTRYYNGGEYSKVIKTESSHWRSTASTCMTFGAKVKTLKEDIDTWKEHASGSHPWDHKIFTDLAKKGRKLLAPIPGAACHTDLTFSGMIGKTLIEPWAIEMMIKLMEDELSQEKEYVETINKSGWERLVALDALRLQTKKAMR